MDALTRLEQGDEERTGPVPAPVQNVVPPEVAQNNGETEHDYSTIAKQYGALFKKDEPIGSDDEANLSDGLRNASLNMPKLNEHEK